MQRSVQPPMELSAVEPAALDLATHEPPTEPAAAGMVEVQDICEVDPALRTDAPAANTAPACADEDAVEIELSAEQIDALLSGPGSFE